MKYHRIFNDPTGESHIEEIEVPQNIVNLPPPMLPIKGSENYPATSYNFVTFPPNWDGGWHLAPTTQFAVQVSGVFEAESSDGKIVRLGPGEVCIMEDMTGKGHKSKNVGKGEAEILFIQV